jgi:beta-barrel assembly-enhancing protease
VNLMRILPVALFACVFGTPALAVGTDDLPDIGSPAEAAISLDDEYRIGLSVLREYRNAHLVVEDPEISQYIDDVGHRLSSAAQNGNFRFHFVVVKDPTVNAFAVPGGFVFVHSGLLLATHNESELAGVLAHEISHVTQRHLVRSLMEQRRSSMASTAAMLLAILAGAATHSGGDAAMAGIAGAQTLALAEQMSFSRDMESEADRIGMGVLAEAGFDPNGMPNFFETMGRLGGGKESQIPAIVMNHPITSERIAEARSRAVKYEGHLVTDSIGYALTQERVRVVTTAAGENPTVFYLSVANRDLSDTPARRYGKAIAFIAAGAPNQAVPILEQLSAHDETVVQYRIALGQALSLAGNNRAALASFQQSLLLFPRDVPLTIRYADALLRANESKRAHEVLLDLFNVVAPTPDQARQIAVVANAAGDIADAYAYMAEFHLMNGDLSLAANQLQMALSVPKITEVQRARFRARLEEIRAAMPKRMRMQANDPNQNRRLQ